MRHFFIYLLAFNILYFLDEAWDDVERKIKPVENPYDFKKKLILDQEKSKLSLSQVYEEEYLKQKGDAEAAQKAPGVLDDDVDKDKPELVDEIKSRMKELFVKLDTLTHYHYTPQALNAEVSFPPSKFRKYVIIMCFAVSIFLG